MPSITTRTRKINEPNIIPLYFKYVARCARSAAKLKPPNMASVPIAAAAITLGSIISFIIRVGRKVSMTKNYA